MKKLSLVFLLTAALLLTACDEGAGAVNSTTTGTTTTTTTSATNPPDDPVTPDEDAELTEAMNALVEKFGALSEPTGSFASTSPTELIEKALGSMEEYEGGVVGLKASVSANMGMLGSQNEQIESTIKMLGDAYQIITETTSASDGETYSSFESDTFIDGYYYYYYEYKMPGEEDWVEKYKIPMSFDSFMENVAGRDESLLEEEESTDSDEYKQFADMFSGALKTHVGMNAEGDCCYITVGLSQEVLEGLTMFEDLIGMEAGGITEESLSKIASVITLDKDGNLKGIYLDLPLTFNIEEGDFSMTMSMSIQMEITVRAATAEDKIEAPADADEYEEMTFDDWFGYDDWFDEEWSDENWNEEILL